MLKDAPGGTHIVLKGKGPRGTGLVAIGYRYSSKTTLHFIATENAGSSRKGNPYEMKFTDSWGNVCVRLVDRPEIISDFFEDSNVIDTSNHVRQYELALEKKWCTHDPYFRLRTTMEGIGVSQTWFVSRFHNLFERFGLAQKESIDGLKVRRTVPVKTFAGILAKQLIRKADILFSNHNPSANTNQNPTAFVPALISTGATTNEDLSTLDSSERAGPNCRDKIGQAHPMVWLPKYVDKKGKMRRKQRFCQKCKVVDGKTCNTSALCVTCGRAFCTPSTFNQHRNCFRDHVENCGLFEHPAKRLRRAPRRDTNTLDI